MTSEDTIIASLRQGIQIVQYNKPYKKNAIDSDMYRRIISILNNAAEDDDISLAVLTGTGNFYSSGYDFSVPGKENKYNAAALREFVDTFITFPKLLIAVVNGPAIGIAATTLALCDLVFASEDSYFVTPFTKLGIVAEGCSTITFPRLLGDRKATEMLLFNYKMSAREALEYGFVNYVYKQEELQEVWNKIEELSKLPRNSVSLTKKLIRDTNRVELLAANKRETEELQKVWASGGGIKFKTKL